MARLMITFDFRAEQRSVRPSLYRSASHHILCINDENFYDFNLIKAHARAHLF